MHELPQVWISDTDPNINVDGTTSYLSDCSIYGQSSSFMSGMPPGSIGANILIMQKLSWVASILMHAARCPSLI